MKTDRIKMVKAMEYIVRQINNNDIFEKWLFFGIPDGDIPYGDLSNDNGEEIEFWTEDKHFSELMGLFLEVMTMAKKNGGLYCDDIVSE